MSGAEPWEDNEEFDDLISLLREGPIELGDETPSDDLWAGISAELGLAGAPAEEQPSEQIAPSAPFVEAEQRAVATDNTTIDNVVSLSERRPGWGRPAAILTLAAAVVLLLAVPVTLALTGGDDVDVVASADLELLEGQAGTEVAAQVISVDGDLRIDVEAPTEVADGEFLELWLLEVGDDGVQALESLGRVDGSGQYDVPDDVDLDRFSVVDISVELDDGNPDHSGNSVVRGELT